MSVVVFGREGALETKVVIKFLNQQEIQYKLILERPTSAPKRKMILSMLLLAESLFSSGRFKALSPFRFFTWKVFFQLQVFKRSKRRRELEAPFCNVSLQADICVPSINHVRAYKYLEANSFDYALLAGVGIVDECILDIISIATLNAHPGPLPECRGGGSLEQALYKNFLPAVSVHIVTPGIDEGDILKVEKLSLEKNESYDSVYFRLGILCGEVLVRVLKKALQEGEYRRSPNNGELHYWIDANELVQKTARLNLKALQAEQC